MVSNMFIYLFLFLKWVSHLGLNTEVTLDLEKF